MWMASWSWSSKSKSSPSSSVSIMVHGPCVAATLKMNWTPDFHFLIVVTPLLRSVSRSVASISIADFFPPNIGRVDFYYRVHSSTTTPPPPPPTYIFYHHHGATADIPPPTPTLPRRLRPAGGRHIQQSGQRRSINRCPPLLIF